MRWAAGLVEGWLVVCMAMELGGVALVCLARLGLLLGDRGGACIELLYQGIDLLLSSIQITTTSLQHTRPHSFEFKIRHQAVPRASSTSTLSTYLTLLNKHY